MPVSASWKDRIEDIYTEWEANILVELNNYRDNLQYLKER
jgi:hypothetical protein